MRWKNIWPVEKEPVWFEVETRMSNEYDIYRNNFLTLDIYYGELTRRVVEMTPSYVMESFFSKFVSCKSVRILHGVDIPDMHEPRLGVADWGSNCIFDIICFTAVGFGLLASRYSDVIMGTMVSQITSLTIVYSTVHSGADQRKASKLRTTGLCAGNSPETGKFLAQMASYAENVSI